MSGLTITYTKRKRKRQTSNSASDSCTYPQNACHFCRSAENREEVYGKFIRKCGFVVHYFCMLFASGLSQRGKTDSQGILGFMPADIRRELKRGNRLRCTYCKNKGATIGCVVTSCRRVFHFRCGRKEGSLHQFYDIFRSYCPDHRPLQPVQISDRLAFKGTANATCSICMYAVVARSTPDTLRAPCCKNSWFHRGCIQRYAMSSGLYFFKCPLCNSKDLFQSEMLQYGVYIPDQDASWEREPNAYQDLYARYTHCDALTCKCSQGRSHDGQNIKWEIVVCEFCGSHGSHKACHGLKPIKKGYICAACEEIDHKSKHKKGKNKLPKKKNLTQAELQQLLKDRIDKIVSDQSESKQNTASSKSSIPLQPKHEHSRSHPRRSNLRSQGDPEVVIIDKEDTDDCFVDVEACESDDDDDDEDDSIGARKSRRLSLSVTRTSSKKNPRQSSTVTSNIELTSSDQSCSASIETKSAMGKYSNYVTLSTISHTDIRKWGNSDSFTQASTSATFQSPGLGEGDDIDEDSLFMDMSDSSDDNNDDDDDDQMCDIDEVRQDDSKKTVMIKWKGKNIRIYKEVEKNAREDISKWSLHLEVGDNEDNVTPRSSPVEQSPPQLVPIDNEITIRCTPPTRPYMLKMPSEQTPIARYSSRNCSDDTSGRESPGIDGRVTRSMSVETGNSDGESRHSRRSVEFEPQTTYAVRQVKRDIDSESVITVSSNASENGDESDCLIIEPSAFVANRRRCVQNEQATHQAGPSPHAARFTVGSPFKDGEHPEAVPYRQIPSGHDSRSVIIDLTEGPSETWEGFADANYVSSPRTVRSQNSHNP